MRRLTLAALLIITTLSVASVAQTFKITMTHMPQGQQVGIVARNIERGAGATHATGNVQVRITPIHPDEGRTVIYADEVIYHGDTGEIETRGYARITIEKAQ